MFSGKIEDYILFEDKEIIVCRKPAGIAVQNARIGAMDLESSLKNYLAMQASGGRRIPYLAVIHRLDQPVEGILVFGKTPEAAKSLSAQITAGKMEKIYLAVTYGKQAEFFFSLHRQRYDKKAIYKILFSQPRPAFHMLLPDKFFPSFQL